MIGAARGDSAPIAGVGADAADAGGAYVSTAIPNIWQNARNCFT